MKARLLLIFLVGIACTLSAQEDNYNLDAKIIYYPSVYNVKMSEQEYMDKCSRALRYNNIDGRITIGHYISDCLMEEAFNGSDAHIEQLVFILEQMPVEDYGCLHNFKKFRGEKLFKVFLSKANNFECFPIYDDRLTVKGSVAVKILSYMIDNIDGESKADYFMNNRRSRSRIPKQQCRGKAKSAEDGYLVLKEAYELGLIKLKAFGE